MLRLSPMSRQLKHLLRERFTEDGDVHRRSRRALQVASYTLHLKGYFREGGTA